MYLNIPIYEPFSNYVYLEDSKYNYNWNKYLENIT